MTKKIDKNNSIVHDEVIPKWRRAREEFIKKRNNNMHSAPADWMNGFLGDDKVILSSNACFDRWTRHKNLKATLMGAGLSHATFALAEIKKFLDYSSCMAYHHHLKYNKSSGHNQWTQSMEMICTFMHLERAQKN